MKTILLRNYKTGEIRIFRGDEAHRDAGAFMWGRDTAEWNAYIEVTPKTSGVFEYQRKLNESLFKQQIQMAAPSGD